MLGLLYKDYIAVKGKIFLMILFGQFALWSILNFLVTDEDLIDLIPMMALTIYAVLAFTLAGQYTLGLMNADEGKKQKHYFLSLPIERKQYVASKYIFLAIAFYILQSVVVFHLQVLMAQDAGTLQKTFTALLQVSLPMFLSICMIIAAIELLLYFSMGVKKAQGVSKGIVFLLLFVFAAYLMFGDLSVFDTMDLATFVTYLQEHMEMMYAVQILFPLVAIVVFYLSYRVSVKLFEKREWEDE